MTFKDDLQSDLTYMLSSDEFGDEITFTPVSTPGSPETHDAHFNNEFEEVDPGGVATVSSNKPNITVNVDNFVIKPQQGDAIVVRSVNYKILEPQEDGVGISVIFLHEV